MRRPIAIATVALSLLVLTGAYLLARPNRGPTWDPDIDTTTDAAALITAVFPGAAHDSTGWQVTHDGAHMRVLVACDGGLGSFTFVVAVPAPPTATAVDRMRASFLPFTFITSSDGKTLVISTSTTIYAPLAANDLRRIADQVVGRFRAIYVVSSRDPA